MEAALPEQTRLALMARAQASVRAVVASMLSDRASKVHWKPKLRRGAVSYYVDEASVAPGQTRFCCVAHSSARVEEVLPLFLLTDTDSLLRNNRIVYNNVLEARVLAVLQRPTRDRPFRSAYVRYSCFQTPAPMANRDMCVAVTTDVFTDPEDGATIGYCLWDSVDKDDYDRYFAPAVAAGTVSTSAAKAAPVTMFRSGFFLRRAAPSASASMVADGLDEQAETKIVYLVGMEPGGWAPNLTTRLLMQKFGANLSRLCSHLRRRRLDSSTFVLKSEWAPKSGARACRGCRRPFQMLTPRVNCHACGHVVCRACTSKETVELQAVGLVPMRICLTCLQGSGLLSLPSPLTLATSTHARSVDASASGGRRIHGRARANTGGTASSDADNDLGDADEWEMTPTGSFRPFRAGS